MKQKVSGDCLRLSTYTEGGGVKNSQNPVYVSSLCRAPKEVFNRAIKWELCQLSAIH